MPIDIRIEDADLVGFSDPAKEGLQKAGLEFLKAVVAEANRLESGHNIAGGPVEITQVMVADAVVIQRRSIGARKTSTLSKAIKIIAAVLSLIVGFMYDDQKLQNAGYMALFVIFVAGAILTTTISTMKE
jgi:hypothetical protein